MREAGTTFVASVLPPTPTSITAHSTRFFENVRNANAVNASKYDKVFAVFDVAASAAANARVVSFAAASAAAAPASSAPPLPPTGPHTMRSPTERTWGLLYVPVFTPASRRMDARNETTLPLPLVPATWITGYPTCGSPSAARSRRMRPRSNRSAALDATPAPFGTPVRSWFWNGARNASMSTSAASAEPSASSSRGRDEEDRARRHHPPNAGGANGACAALDRTRARATRDAANIASSREKRPPRPRSRPRGHTAVPRVAVCAVEPQREGEGEKTFFALNFVVSLVSSDSLRDPSLHRGSGTAG